jgi:hypothetical protein
MTRRWVVVPRRAAFRSKEHGRDFCIAEEVHSRIICPARFQLLYSARDPVAGSPFCCRGFAMGRRSGDYRLVMSVAPLTFSGVFQGILFQGLRGSSENFLKMA